MTDSWTTNKETKQLYKRVISLKNISLIGCFFFEEKWKLYFADTAVKRIQATIVSALNAEKSLKDKKTKATLKKKTQPTLYLLKI